MRIKKQYLKNKSAYKVFFKVPKEAGNGATQMHVVGEFNQWDKGATPMKTQKGGSFAATVILESDKEYQFRYLADGIGWLNDEKADTYMRSPYENCDNCVIKT